MKDSHELEINKKWKEEIAAVKVMKDHCAAVALEARRKEKQRLIDSKAQKFEDLTAQLNTTKTNSNKQAEYFKNLKTQLDILKTHCEKKEEQIYYLTRKLDDYEENFVSKADLIKGFVPRAH
jgi:hypothetical protein